MLHRRGASGAVVAMAIALTAGSCGGGQAPRATGVVLEWPSGQATFSERVLVPGELREVRLGSARLQDRWTCVAARGPEDVAARDDPLPGRISGEVRALRARYRQRPSSPTATWVTIEVEERDGAPCYRRRDELGVVQIRRRADAAPSDSAWLAAAVLWTPEA